MRILLLFISCVLYACGGETLDKEPLVQKFYEQKVQALSQERLELCKEKVLQEAKASVDSLIDTWVNAELIDTIRFPAKPVKPFKPDPIIDKFQKFELDSSVMNK